MTTVLLVAGLTIGVTSAAVAADPATCTGNAIVCENQLPGTPQSVWDVDGAGDSTIQGFATQISVNLGQTEQFKINSDASAYSIDIYRLGYYQGNGARKIASVSPSASLPQTQPACATDATTEIYDCGTWGVSASWTVPTDVVSGVYIALLTRTDTGGASQIPFIVRDDSSHAAVVYQTSDPTWEAYNTYGVSDFYQGLANGRAYKVSYNRPFSTRGSTNGRDFLFSNEYPMLRFLEQNGYDLTYISGLDTDINGGLLTNHQAFVSTGHDEYWSAGQRANVEKARDAGVSLAFFSGNEVYWKTRWEASEDGNNTPNRTLVCYKDTWANAQIDPLGPTDTWRDPRWGGTGKGPENALTGTIYMANSDDLPVTVSSTEGKNRLWRNTSLGSQPAGTSTALAPHTVGYESDEDIDNGFRPAGLIDLSTTIGSTPQYLQDFGNTVLPGTTTHHLTEYRVASGALVFGAGTVQWAWGLDTDHDGTVSPVDTRMQQATINVLADMGASATTVMSGLTASTKSDDTVAPTAVITSPASGSTIGNGSSVTVTGTATDAGGGVVAGVEVSLDGGSSWHPSTLTLSGSTYSFTYTGILGGVDSSAIRARAVDDSANIQSPATTVSVTNGCPCSIFGNAVPGTAATTDTSSVTLGTQFTASTTGYITGIRFYKGSGNTGTHVGTLYTSSGAALASASFINETATGWQSASFPAAIPVTAGTTYVVAYTAPFGHYSADSWYFDYVGHNGGRLAALGGMSKPNGVYAGGAAFPNQSYQQTNYYVDALYSPTDTTPLTVSSATPVAGSSSNAVSSTVTATFSRDIDTSSLAVSVKATSSGAPVSGTVTYDAPSRTATFAPSSALSSNTAYTVTVSADPSSAGVTSTPLTFSFTTAAPDGVANSCPCTLFNDSSAPASAPWADGSVELGTAFTTESAGLITGVRFYKAVGNSGIHTVSLWDQSGKRLATAVVAGESTQGWQQASFASPVNVSPGGVYTVSYHAPAGGYSADAGGLASALDKAPLHTQPGAGRYIYSTTAAPTGTSSANYYVDPVFAWDPSVVPTVSSVDPAGASTSVPTSAAVRVAFSSAVQAGTPTVTVTPDGGSAVTGTTTLNASGTVATFTPTTALTAGTHYTIAVSGAKSLGGTAMTAMSTGFTTAGATACPCTLLASAATPALADAGDGSAVTVGTQFTSASNGYITGIRYYRAAANTGIHTGTLYTSTGTAMASVTFTDGAAGWTTANLSAPVAITAGTGYVVAVFDPAGHYSAAGGFFASPYVNAPLTGTGGFYAYGGTAAFPTSSYNNGFYYVDPIFQLNAGTAPTVTSTTPSSGAVASVLPSGITASFDQAVDSTSLTVAVTTSTGTAVAGTTAYSATSQTATFIPSTALAYSTSYVVKVSAANVFGTAMTPVTWTFSTGAKLAAPTVTATNPAASAKATSLTTVTATFSQAMIPSSIAFTLATWSGAAVPGTLTYDSSAQIATFTTSANLTYGTTYTAKVSGSNVQGTAMTSPRTWSFSTTAALAAPSVSTVTPASGSTTTTLPTTITAKFAAAIDPSTLTFGVTAGGTAVAGTTAYTSSTYTATFTPSTALNWSTTYTATVNAANTQGLSMAAAKTWSFATPAQIAAPLVTATTPAASPTTIPAKVTATFAAAIDSTTLSIAVTTAGNPVAGTTTYSSSTRVATFTPSAVFAAATAYTATVNAKNTQGAAMSPVTWTFTTPAVFTLFPATSTPAYASYPDSQAATVGTKFTSDKAGVVTGVSFYDGPSNTATTVYLYSSTGALLGSGSAASATTGWRTVALSTPVSIAAGATYTVAYYAPAGSYALTANGFGSGVNAVPLHAASNAGVYRLATGYPSSATANNYWVSPVLALASGS